jgi:flagellar protein FliO/FliZ
MTSAGELLHMVFGLVVVFGALWLLARLARRRGLSGLGAPRHGRIDVLARRGLSRQSAIAVVRVGTRTLLIGTTNHSVTLLADLDSDPVLDAEEASTEPAGGLPALLDPSGATTAPGNPRRVPPSTAAWMADLIERFRERTVRRAS